MQNVAKNVTQHLVVNIMSVISIASDASIPDPQAVKSQCGDRTQIRKRAYTVKHPETTVQSFHLSRDLWIISLLKNEIGSVRRTLGSL